MSLLLREGRPGRPVVLFEAPSRVADTLTALAALEPPAVDAAQPGVQVGVVLCRELTKAHEEVVRCASLAEAARLVARRAAAGDASARGEWVLVLHVTGGRQAEEEGVSVDEALALVARAVAGGAAGGGKGTMATAVRAVSAATGISRKALYEAWLRRAA
jgi:16S rRNA C1402 (ribose-2'-O) methylase RsmI